MTEVENMWELINQLMKPGTAWAQIGDTVNANMVIVIPKFSSSLILTAPQLLPGVNRITIDFSEGRLDDCGNPDSLL